jgi:hypothetical protein
LAAREPVASSGGEPAETAAPAVAARMLGFSVIGLDLELKRAAAEVIDVTA